MNNIESFRGSIYNSKRCSNTPLEKLVEESDKQKLNLNKSWRQLENSDRNLSVKGLIRDKHDTFEGYRPLTINKSSSGKKGGLGIVAGVVTVGLAATILYGVFSDNQAPSQSNYNPETGRYQLKE
ncbi:MAG: hypothetical protein VXZ40_02765 [Nanoarchaeota archaeon]|nr:hypothetical protein [Nanoarchaeota archaeon]